MRQLKVKIFTNTFLPEFGAAPSRWYDLSQTMADEGAAVEVITGMPNYPAGKIHPSYRGKLLVQEHIGEVSVRRYWLFPSHSANPLTRLFTMLSLAFSSLFALPALIRDRPDWVMVQHPPVALPLVAWVAARLSGARFVLNFSDLWPQAIESLNLKGIAPFYNLLVAYNQWLCKRADLLVAQNQEIVEYLKTQHSDKPVLLMRTAADCRRFRPSGQAKPVSQTIKFVYAGVLGMAHGMAQLCETLNFKDLGAELHIYGEGCERRAIAQHLASHPEKGIFLHPPVRPSEVPELLSGFDIALIAQRERIFGTVPSKLYEAMASGLPIMFMGSGEGAEIVERLACGIAGVPISTEKAEEYIKQMVELSAEKRSEMGRNARNAALIYFNRTHHFGFLINFLKNQQLTDRKLLKVTENEQPLTDQYQVSKFQH